MKKSDHEELFNRIKADISNKLVDDNDSLMERIFPDDVSEESLECMTEDEVDFHLSIAGYSPDDVASDILQRLKKDGAIDVNAVPLKPIKQLTIEDISSMDSKSLNRYLDRENIDTSSLEERIIALNSKNTTKNCIEIAKMKIKALVDMVPVIPAVTASAITALCAIVLLPQSKFLANKSDVPTIMSKNVIMFADSALSKIDVTKDKAEGTYFTLNEDFRKLYVKMVIAHNNGELESRLPEFEVEFKYYMDKILSVAPIIDDNPEIMAKLVQDKRKSLWTEIVEEITV